MGQHLLLVVGLVVAVIAAWVFGALIAALFPPGWLGLSLAGVTALIVCVVLPVVFDRRLLTSTRKTDPRARSLVGEAFLLIDGVLLAATLVLWPQQARSALESRGDWVLFAPSGSRHAEALQAFSRRIAAFIPRSEPSGLPSRGDPTPAVGQGSASARALAPLSSSAASGQSRSSSASPITTDPSGDARGIKSGIASAASAATQGTIAEDRPVQGPSEVFRKYADAVVVITTLVDFDSNSPFAELYRHLGIRTMESFGSGFVIDKRGLVVTNHHVVNNATSLQVKLRDGRVASKVTKLAELGTHDLALLEIDVNELRPVTLADDEAVQIGDPAIAIGCPQGLEYTLTTGIVSALREQGKTTMIQMQTTISSGSSGGPLFANDGALIGVNTATEGAGLNYAVRVKHVRELLAAPRKPRAFQAFEGGVQVTRLDAEGIEPGPTEHANLAEILRLWGSALDQCIETIPDGAYLSYHFTSADISSEPVRESNLSDQLLKCSSPFLRLILLQTKMLVLAEHADRFASGFSVVAELGGLRAAGDRETSSLRLTLRFGGKPEPAADAGTGE